VDWARRFGSCIEGFPATIEVVEAEWKPPTRAKPKDGKTGLPVGLLIYRGVQTLSYNKVLRPVRKISRCGFLHFLLYNRTRGLEFGIMEEESILAKYAERFWCDGE
jgi:hypothetical protein